MDTVLSSSALTNLLIDTAIKATILLVLMAAIVSLFARKKPVWSGLRWTSSLAGLLILPLAPSPFLNAPCFLLWRMSPSSGPPRLHPPPWDRAVEGAWHPSEDTQADRYNSSG